MRFFIVSDAHLNFDRITLSILIKNDIDSIEALNIEYIVWWFLICFQIEYSECFWCGWRNVTAHQCCHIVGCTSLIFDLFE